MTQMIADVPLSCAEGAKSATGGDQPPLRGRATDICANLRHLRITSSLLFTP
jgi:hypothetical protein